jgi:hypothetical protein
MNGAITLCRRLGQNADEINDGIRSRDCSIYSDVVKHISLDDLHCLGRCGRHLGTAGLAYGQAHRLATSDKHRHEMTADEPGPAEHCDGAGHDSSPWHSLPAMHHQTFKGRRYYSTIHI